MSNKEVRLVGPNQEDIIAPVLHETKTTVIIRWGDSAKKFSKKTGKRIIEHDTSWTGWKLDDVHIIE